MKRGYVARQERRESAEERQAERVKRGDRGQLDRLIKLGHGHCREAQRLTKKFNRK